MYINKVEVGKRIFTTRKSLGLTMKEFGERIGTPVASDSIVSRWEKGKSLPNNERLKRIAEIGGMSVNELLYGDFKARITKILLDKPEVDEDFIDFVLNYFINTNNRYPTKEEVFEEYDNIINMKDNAVEKGVAQRLLAINIRLAEEDLFKYLTNPSEDEEYTLIKNALSKLAEATSSYEGYFDKSVDEVYEENKK